MNLLSRGLAWALGRGRQLRAGQNGIGMLNAGYVFTEDDGAAPDTAASPNYN